jgi:hypothetical protein
MVSSSTTAAEVKQMGHKTAQIHSDPWSALAMFAGAISGRTRGWGAQSHDVNGVEGTTAGKTRDAERGNSIRDERSVTRSSDERSLG